MENCALMQEWISRMLDGELEAEERAALAKHLEECPECRAMYEAFAAVSESLQNDLTEAPESLRENVMAELRREEIRKRNQRIRRSALSVAAVAVLVLGLRFGLNSSAPQAPVAASARQFEETAAGEALEDRTEAENTAAAGKAEVAAVQNAAEPEAVMEEAASAAPPLAMESRVYSAAMDSAAAAASAAPLYDLSEEMDLAALLEYLGGDLAALAPDRTAEGPVGTVLVSDGSLELYEAEGHLYYFDPESGQPLWSGRGMEELVSLTGD